MDSEKAKMLNGERYDADDPELVADRERARDLRGGTIGRRPAITGIDATCWKTCSDRVAMRAG